MSPAIKRYDRRLQVLVPAEQKRRAETMAARRGMSLGELVRGAIDRELERLKSEKQESRK
jgi:predicted HicB family RNase H-like nuclease